MKTHKFIFFHELNVSNDLTWLQESYDLMHVSDIDREIEHSYRDLEHEGGDDEWKRFNNQVIIELTAIKEMMTSRDIKCIIFDPEQKKKS